MTADPDELRQLLANEAAALMFTAQALRDAWLQTQPGAGHRPGPVDELSADEQLYWTSLAGVFRPVLVRLQAVATGAHPVTAPR